VSRIDEPEVVEREYASLDRYRRRRIDVTGWLRFTDDDEWAVLLRAIAEVRPHRVLDAGCGDGTLSSLVAATEVVCVDQSPAAVEAARGRGLDARVADIRELPFRDGEFDLVLCAETLEHVRDVQLLLSETRRVLRPGGTLALSTPAYGRRTGVAVIVRGFEAVFDPLSPHLRCFSKRSLARLLEQLGFDVASLRRDGGSLLAVATR
jgi:SAM-dependent methyltransferase